MAKYTFICEHIEAGDGLKNITEFRSDYLPDVLDNLELFLRGAGFYFDGKLQIINEQDYPLPEEIDDFPDDGVFFQVVQSHMDYLDSKQSYCTVCGLSKDVMQGQKCFDPICPKGQPENAN